MTRRLSGSSGEAVKQRKKHMDHITAKVSLTNEKMYGL